MPVDARMLWQPSLLEQGPASGDHDFSALTRTCLDGSSWVDYAPGWLSGGDELFEEVLRTARWQQREVWMYERTVREPRLTAGWSVGPGSGTGTGSGTGSGEPAPLGQLPSAVRDICGALSDRYGVHFDSVWVNLYRDGADSVAWHGDRNRHVLTNPLVATVSLGAGRRFLLRPVGTTPGGPTRATRMHTFEPGHGDLVVMGGACQHDWQHCVPKTARPVGPRMSVTIRHSG